MRYSITRGIRGSGLPPIRNILRRWQTLNAAIGTEWARDYSDSPWWYNERASLSFFAGAVWRSGGWALEEYSSIKKAPAKAKTLNKRTGRYDINFAVGHHEYIAEAKQCWPLLSNMRTARAILTNSIRSATFDSRLTISWGLPVLSIVFAAPRILASQVRQVPTLLAQFLSLPLPAGIIAWSFPRAARSLQPSDSRYIFPGMLVHVRQVRKSA